MRKVENKPTESKWQIDKILSVCDAHELKKQSQDEGRVTKAGSEWLFAAKQ